MTTNSPSMALTNQTTTAEKSNPSWRWLYKRGAAAAFAGVLIIPIPIAVYIIWPPGLSSKCRPSARLTPWRQLPRSKPSISPLVAIYHGTAFNAHYLLGTIALLILSFVMLRSEQFSKGTAYTGIVSNGWTSSTFL